MRLLDRRKEPRPGARLRLTKLAGCSIAGVAPACEGTATITAAGRSVTCGSPTGFGPHPDGSTRVTYAASRSTTAPDTRAGLATVLICQEPTHLDRQPRALGHRAARLKQLPPRLLNVTAQTLHYRRTRQRPAPSPLALNHRSAHHVHQRPVALPHPATPGQPRRTTYTASSIARVKSRPDDSHRETLAVATQYQLQP